MGVGGLWDRWGCVGKLTDPDSSRVSAPLFCAFRLLILKWLLHLLLLVQSGADGAGVVCVYEAEKQRLSRNLHMSNGP